MLMTIRTRAGKVTGARVAGTTRFFGIPYAAPPVGPLRFAAPQAVEPWQGVRAALRLGPSAAQLDPRAVAPPEAVELLDLLYPGTGEPTEGGRIDEDCLRLNVWTPECDDRARPVLVWLHGGAFQHGSPNERVFAGDVLAREQDMVVVHVGHRLGVLGFSGLDVAAGSATAGLLDVVLALRWVRDEIARFGGDPENVTVAGQSGGGMKVACLLTMPAARGLFHKAVMQSGPGLRVSTAEAGLAQAARVLELSQTADVRELRGLPLERVLRAQRALEAEVAVHKLDLTKALPIGPIIDRHLPRQLFSESSTEGVADVPVLLGSTSHEVSMLLSALPAYASADEQSVTAMLDAVTGGGGEMLVKAYRALFPDEAPALVWARAESDATFRGGTYRVAEVKSRQQSPVFAYLFDGRTDVLGGTLGSPHSLDLPYVFGTLDRVPYVGSQGGDVALSRLMRAVWGSFARTGVPHAAGLPDWPTWREGRRAVQLGGVHSGQVVAALDLAPGVIPGTLDV